ncbi:MAG: FecR domain-containing protein [Alistipes sp.]|nr:FecR domain-containing protein [Alistipes sp.]
MIAGNGKINSRELIKKFFEGNYPTDIERRFHLWLLNESNREEKEEGLKDMWESIPCGNPETVKGSLHAVRTKLGMPATTVRLGRRRLALRVAAVIIPFLLVAGGYYLADRYAGTPAKEPIARTVEALAGMKVVLPDNSVVEITEGLLTYPEHFTGPERTVTLEGSGYFEVVTDAGKPFVIHGNTMDVRVTGTEFMFTNDRETMVSTVYLVEGSVDVTAGENGTVALEQGHSLRYDSVSGEITIGELALGKEALTTGRLIFENATLSDIINASTQSRGYELIIRQMDRGSKTYNIKFISDENIEEILGVLSVLADGSFRYTIENNKVYIE